MEMGAAVVVRRKNCDPRFDQSIGVANNTEHLLWYKEGLHQKRPNLTPKGQVTVTVLGHVVDDWILAPEYRWEKVHATAETFSSMGKAW